MLLHSNSSLTCLINLVEAGYKPGLVISHKDYENEKLNKSFYTPLKKFCKTNKIKLIQSDKPSELKEAIKNSDVGVCVGYMKILRKEFFELPKYGIYNLHCGKLPEYRGRAPISRTIISGDSDLIMTVHKIDEGVDSGNIAIEDKIRITSKDDVNSLYQKFSSNSHKSIIELLKSIEKNKVILKKQRRTQRKAYTVLSELECKINWKTDAVKIFNQIRALRVPYPSAYFIYNGNKYKVNNASLSNVKAKNKPGTVEKIFKDTLLINTKSEMLKISEISLNGKSLDVNNFSKGDIFI
jgi:methionyl-tRNA formyltransferase